MDCVDEEAGRLGGQGQAARQEEEAGGQEGSAQSPLYYHISRRDHMQRLGMQWINSEEKQEDADDEQMYQQQDGREDGQEQ